MTLGLIPGILMAPSKEVLIIHQEESELLADQRVNLCADIGDPTWAVVI